jgi:hypothetical protein
MMEVPKDRTPPQDHSLAARGAAYLVVQESRGHGDEPSS